MTSADRFRAGAIVVLIALHVVGAALLGWRAPHGFDVFTLHFFSNQALPIVVCVACVSMLLTRNVGAAARAMCSLWLGASVTAVVLFPRSTWRLVLVAMALSGLLGVLARGTNARFRAVAIALGLLGG